MDELFFYFLVGMVGGDIANEISKSNKRINLPVTLVFSSIFSFIYTIGLISFLLIHFIKGYLIPWSNLGIVSIIIASLVAITIFIADKLRKN